MITAVLATAPDMDRIIGNGTITKGSTVLPCGNITSSLTIPFPDAFTLQ